MLKSNKGFTLVELVLVIVILAILAAVAIPRFIDLRTEARKSTARGIGGAIASNILMRHSAYLLWNSDYSPKTIANEMDVGGGATLTGFSASTGANSTMVATIGSATFAWYYTARSGVAAARITEITGF